MRYESMMLSKHQFECFKLFEALMKIPKKEYHLKDLGSLTGFSNAKVKYSLEKISEVVELIDPQQAAVFADTKCLDMTKVTVSLTDFRYTILTQHSLAFQFLLEVLMNKEPDIEAFLAKHFVSLSTVNRAVRELQKYLRNYGIHISITNFTIECQEEDFLRQALYYLFWLGTKGRTELFEPYEIDERLIDKFLLQLPKEHHYIARKMFRLRLIIQYFRVRTGNLVPRNFRAHSLMDDPDDFPQDLVKHNDLIPQELWISESHSIFSSTLFYPIFVEYDEALMTRRFKLFQEKGPLFLALADSFLAYFETEFFPEAIPQQKREMLLLNLTQMGACIWAYNGNFPNLHYFLHFNNTKNEGNLRYENQVREYFQSERVQEFLSLREYFPVIEKTFADILQPYYVDVMAWTHLNVGIVVEPNSILLDKIKIVLDSVYFVNYELFCEETPEKYDLVVTTTGFFAQDFPGIPFYAWNIAEEDEDLPYLFYRLRDIFYQQKKKIRFI